MFELCMVISISIGYLDGLEHKVLTLDCNHIEYKTIELDGKLIEVIQEDNIIYIKEEI